MARRLRVKGKKRPKSWHRGLNEARLFEQALQGWPGEMEVDRNGRPPLRRDEERRQT